MTTSDGSTASYYELPAGCTELQDLISYRNLNAQDGEIFRAIYRKGRASHSDELRDARKVLFYAQAEVKRLEALHKPTAAPDNAPAWPDDPKWKWMAQDESGAVWAYTQEPQIGEEQWFTQSAEVIRVGYGDNNLNWRHTLRQRPTPTTNAGPMLHCADCSAEHCPCVAR